MFETCLLSSLNVRLRIDVLSRLCRAGLNRLRKVVVSDHFVMPASDALSVPDPRTDDVLGMAVSQLRLPTGSQVVEDAGPRSKTCTPRLPRHLCSEFPDVSA